MKGVFRPRLDLICVLGNGPTSHAIKPVGSDTGKAVLYNRVHNRVNAMEGRTARVSW